MPCSLSAVSLLLAVSALAQTTPTTVSLTSSTNPAKFGLPVTLTATLSSSAATGKVTFYSGTDILETVPIASGKAVLSTIALPFGSQSLYAYYGGDGTFAPSKSAVLQLTVNTAPGYGFQPVVSYPTEPAAITAADFNGDGIPDLAVVPDSPYPSVSVFIGKGDGSFQPAVSYPINGSPESIAAGDLNGDGHMDLVAGFYSGNEISVLLGNGDGTFQSPVIYPAGSGPFYQVAVADLNGDGNADLIALNYDGEDVTVLIGNGDGTFQPPLPQNSGNYPNSIAIGDFNGDGNADLAIGGDPLFYTDEPFTVLLGNGNGTFQAPQSYGPGDLVTLADFNGDGITDVALANYSPSQVIVLLGNGNGTFQAPLTYPLESGPEAIAVGDFNGDGRADLVLGSYNETVNILLGNGDGTFQDGIELRLCLAQGPIS